MSEIPNDLELNDVESAFRRLSPIPSMLDRDRLMFQAGVLSRRRFERAGWIWPSIAASLALVVTGESVFLGMRPGTHVVVVREPSAKPSSGSVATGVKTLLEPRETWSLVEAESKSATSPKWERVSDLRLRQDLVLRFGLDAFPDSVRRSAQSIRGLDETEGDAMSAGALRRIELEKLNKKGDQS